MNTKLSVVVLALSIASSAFAVADEKPASERSENTATNSVETLGQPADLEEDEVTWFSAGVDLDLLSAYIWRNAVINDELVFQPAAWFEFERLDPVYIGGFVWQNWNMTGSQDADRPRAMNETDFNVHIGATLWETEDEAYAFGLEIGNDFFTYRQIEDCPNSYELYVKARFDNPFVGVYGQYSQAYEPVSACYFEVGLNKEVNVGEALGSESDWLNRFTVGADWNVSLGSGKYFTNYLYGVLPGEYDEETEECDERGMSDGIGGTTVKGLVGYRVCEHFSVGLVVAYTALLSGEACDAMDYAELGNMYKRLVWGGLQAKLDF